MITTTIYYFTGTGNSLKIAKEISDKLGDCELIPIARERKRKNITPTTEKVGFVFPLYYYGLPKIVKDFLQKIDLNLTRYHFAVITRAGDEDGSCFYQLRNIFNSKSKTLDLEFAIMMPNNFIIGYPAPTEEEQKELFENASKNVKKVSELIKQNKSYQAKARDQKYYRRFKRINENFHDLVNASDDKFYIDENCTSCGICERICPVNNIILIDGKPQWQHDCQQCLSCINYCPEKAIKYQGKRVYDDRYHHPEILIKDLTSQKDSN